MINEKPRESLEQNKSAVDIQSAVDSGLALLESSAEKVAEVVGESASENIPYTKTDQKKSDISPVSRVKNLFNRTNINQKSLPIEVQKIEVQKFLEKNIKKLLRKADILSSPYNFSATNLEKILVKIRYQRRLIRQLSYMGKAFIKKLYKKYVLGEQKLAIS